MLSFTSGHKHLPPFFSLQLSSLLFPAQRAPLPRMKSLDVNSFLSVLAGKLFCLFSKKPFCTWGIFSCLLWEVASSFPQNILHLLFKQGALEELWSLKEGWGCCEILCSILLCELEFWHSAGGILSLPGLGPGVDCGEEKLPGIQELGSF